MPNEYKRDISRGMAYLPIEDHGIIGDLHTVALVGNNGTIDWCCIPSFDAPSIFGALLDAERGGFFSIAPHDSPEVRHLQYYLPETNILITRFLTRDGVGEITDFMPIEPARETTKRHRIIRAVRVVRGSMTFELIYYGSDSVDASALLISLTRFTAEADPRIVRTIERIQRELMHEPHVYRYRVDTAADDGLA